MEENRVKIFFKQIWPTVYRIINNIFYFLITLIKSIVSLAIKQIRDL